VLLMCTETNYWFSGQNFS